MRNILLTLILSILCCGCATIQNNVKKDASIISIATSPIWEKINDIIAVSNKKLTITIVVDLYETDQKNLFSALLETILIQNTDGKINLVTRDLIPELNKELVFQAENSNNIVEIGKIYGANYIIVANYYHRLGKLLVLRLVNIKNGCIEYTDTLKIQ